MLHVEPGEIVKCQVDVAMFHDLTGPRRLKRMLKEVGSKIWNRNEVVMDHYVPE